MQIKPQIIDSKGNNLKQKPFQLKQQNPKDKQLKFISQKLSLLNSSQFSYIQLTKNINYLVGEGDLSQNYLKSFFKRKFIQEIKLLSDFYENAYTKSCINCLLFCCKLNWQKKFRIYKYTDQAFEEAMQELPKQRRQMFYFVSLLYIRLYIIYQENCAKIKQFKLTGPSKILNVLIENAQKKTKQNQDKKQELEELQARKQRIQQILQKDSKDLQINKKFFSFQENIRMVIENKQQIEQIVKFQDTKVKTEYLFPQISTKTLDLRNFLIRKSYVQKNKFVFVPMYDNLIFFKFKMEFTNTSKLNQLQKKFQMFFLNSMRIAIKEKIIRMGAKQNDTSQKICNLFLELLQKEKNVHHQSQVFVSVQDQQEQSPERFWFQEFREDLIKAIIEVSNLKIEQKRMKQSQLLTKRKKSRGQVSKFKDADLQVKINKSNKIKNPQEIIDLSQRQFLSSQAI